MTYGMSRKNELNSVIGECHLMVFSIVALGINLLLALTMTVATSLYMAMIFEVKTFKQSGQRRTTNE